MEFPTLIIGGGISGITAAVELAETGHHVVLVEKEPYLGGNVSGFNNYFPKLCPPACGLEINYRRIRGNQRISYYTGSRVKEISGCDGNFAVRIGIEARLVNNRCTSCGRCADVCPEERPGEIGGNEGEKAVYIPGGLSFPMKYTIDPDWCKGEECGRCLEVCDYNAIQLDAKPAEVQIQVKRIILATGWKPYDASRIENYRYVEEPDVITNLEFEHLLASCTRDNKRLTRPSDDKVPERIAFVQCAGSRDQHHLSYCSAVCCSASVKQALTLAEAYPEIKTEIFYIDLRLSGRNEKLLKQADKTGSITFTKGKVGRIGNKNSDGGLMLEVEDIMAGNRRTEYYDLVILATGIVPNTLAVDLPKNSYGFFIPGSVPGIIPAAACKRPMDVASSVRDATAAAMQVMRL